LKATSVWVEGYRSVLDNGRGHSIIVDLPAEQNGANTGATALELSVMSMAGCITTIFRKVAEKRGFTYNAFRVELDAERPEDAPTVTSLKGRMELVTSGEEKEAQTVLRLTLDKACPVGVIFNRAGIKFDWVLTVKKS
jgi:putative redox protein